jgi:hypothetical protein
MKGSMSQAKVAYSTLANPFKSPSKYFVSLAQQLSKFKIVVVLVNYLMFGHQY